MPSVIDNEPYPPFEIVCGRYVLQYVDLVYRHSLLSASVDDEYNLLIAPTRDGYAHLSAEVAVGCVRPSASAGCSSFCLW